MWIFIAAIVIGYFIFRMHSRSNEVLDSVSSAGGMKVKYSVILNKLLASHPDMKILRESRTFIDIGVDGPEGSRHFYFQQISKDKIMIQYELKGYYRAPDFSRNWTFDDSLDQEIMFSLVDIDTLS